MLLEATFTIFMLLHGTGKPIEALELTPDQTFTSVEACQQSARSGKPIARVIQDIQRMVGKKKNRSRIAHIEAECTLVDGREA